MTSAGNKSGVNCMRLYLASMSCANVFMASVFANPGTPSSKMCPSLSNPMSSESMRCFCPTITLSIPIVRLFTNALCCSILTLISRISIASDILL